MNDKELAKHLGALEGETRKNPSAATKADFALAVANISSDNNSVKREASRVVGNLAETFANDLDEAIAKLLANTSDDGTVVRWSAAYALGRIIMLPKYANSDLLEKVAKLADAEDENGIKNQYLAGLKKAAKLLK